jgi:hypothetical protein
MPYESQPGTIPHRVILHLKALPRGQEMSITQIAIDVLGWENARGLKGWLDPAVQGGALIMRLAGARQSFYRIGDGKPLPRAEKDHDPYTVTRVQASAVNSIFAFAKQRHAAPFSAALCSDGRMLLERNGVVISELTAEESTLLQQFLARSQEFKKHQAKAAQLGLWELEREFRMAGRRHRRVVSRESEPA